MKCAGRNVGPEKIAQLQKFQTLYIEENIFLNAQVEKIAHGTGINYNPALSGNWTARCRKAAQRDRACPEVESSRSFQKTNTVNLCR